MKRFINHHPLQEVASQAVKAGCDARAVLTLYSSRDMPATDSDNMSEAERATLKFARFMQSADRCHSFVPEVEEIRISPVVSRKGYLNVLDDRTNTWIKRWVVVRRPYVFIFRDERDSVERGLINLATAQIEYSEDQQAMVRVPNSFSVVTKQRGFLLQTLGNKEVHDWLYAINPL
ncbi:Kinesin-like protein unc-104-like 3 [Homarus americanus]|uniref:Kinesin-like protein unc-104-like 3 n=1 Tax=Homarus americanus TaxID=6706 RepID=A0A8J5MKW4_HOMAM|nr:Kinesin-like protein unc-104-like 3 [Homarus americanus]